MQHLDGGEDGGPALGPAVLGVLAAALVGFRAIQRIAVHHDRPGRFQLAHHPVIEMRIDRDLVAVGLDLGPVLLAEELHRTGDGGGHPAPGAVPHPLGVEHEVARHPDPAVIVARVEEFLPAEDPVVGAEQVGEGGGARPRQPEDDEVEPGQLFPPGGGPLAGAGLALALTLAGPLSLTRALTRALACTGAFALAFAFTLTLTGAFALAFTRALAGTLALAAAAALRTRCGPVRPVRRLGVTRHSRRTPARTPGSRSARRWSRA